MKRSKFSPLGTVGENDFLGNAQASNRGDYLQGAKC